LGAIVRTGIWWLLATEFGLCLPESNPAVEMMQSA
jgi:hypothetical protein